MDYCFQFTGRGQEAHCTDFAHHSYTRILGEQEKIRVSACTRDYISRIPLPAQGRYSKAVSGQVGEDTKTVTNVSGKRKDSSGSLAEFDRTSSLGREISGSGNDAFETFSIGPQGAVVTVQREAIRFNNSNPGSETGSEMVVGRGQCYEGSGHCVELGSARSGVDVHRCKPNRFWSRCRWDDLERSMEYRGDRTSHKLSGDVSHLENTVALQGVSGSETCHVEHRQYGDSLLSQETRGHQVKRAERFGREDCRVVVQEFHKIPLQTHCRAPQCLGRPVVQTRANHTDRMGYSSSASGEVVGGMGQTHVGSVCNQAQSQIANVCIPCTRCSSHGSGCIVHRLDGVCSLCVSSDSNCGENIAKNSGSRLHYLPCSTLLAKANVVPAVAGSSNRCTGGAASVSKDVEAAPVVDLSQPAGEVQTSCVEAIQNCYKKEGFSEQTAKRMAEVHKPSTRAVYESKWKIFSDWCNKRDKNPLSDDVPMIAEFLNERHDKHRVKTSTLAGYRTAIANMLSAHGIADISHNTRLNKLLAKFEQEERVNSTRHLCPEWNLAFVLDVLRKEPFEPMRKCSDKLITFKTVFLWALATGSRSSELHALTRESVARDEDWQVVSVAPEMQFIPKTALVNKGIKVCQEIEIKSLGNVLGREMQDDYLLCPVRALKHYLKRTDKVRKEGQKKLFITFKKGHEEDIVKSTLAGWIKKTILLAYEVGSSEVQQVHRVKAHEVRGMAASWAYFQQVPMENILKAGTWKNHNTFTSYYLKDLTRIRGQMLTLGSLVVSQQRV